MRDAPTAIAGEGQIVGDAGVLDTGQGGDASDHVLEDGGAFSITAAVVEVDFDGGGVRGLKAEIDVEDAQETAHEQASADEQDAGECDLRDDECGAEAIVPAAVGCAMTGGVLERFLQIGAGHAQAGRKPEEHGGAAGDEERPEERGGVDVDVVEQRQGE
jgi:hypothetical protein